MDENKQTPENDGLEKEELINELEQLRDAFQKQLDEETAKAAEEDAEDNSEELIQPLDEIDEPEKEERICECCGENPCDSSFGEDYPYCSECRSLMKHNPINPLGILALIITAAVFVGTVFLSGGVVNDYNTLLSAKEAYSQKRLTDAASYYQSYLSGKTADDSLSRSAVDNAVKTMATLGYFGDANEMIENFVPESRREKYADIQKEYKLLSETSPILNEKFADVLGGKKYNYKKSIGEIDKLIKENAESQKYSAPFLEYTKYLIMLVHKDEEKDLLAQLKKVEEIDNGLHPWIYLPNILTVSAKLGDTETAEEYFNKSIALNTQEMEIYSAYADAFRFGEKPDADKILEIAQAAEKACSENSYPAYHRIYALAYLLKGDGEKANESMEKYMQTCQTSVNDFNLYALCALYVKDSDTYDNVESQLKAYGYDIGKTVKKYKSGKISLTQALTDKGGEI